MNESNLLINLHLHSFFHHHNQQQQHPKKEGKNTKHINGSSTSLTVNAHHNSTNEMVQTSIKNMNCNNNSSLLNDSKLQHLIHKIIKSSSSSTSPPATTAVTSSAPPPKKVVVSSKQVLDTLLSRHREYKRKNGDALQASVDEILIQFANSNKLSTSIRNGSLVIGSSNNSHKRRIAAVPIGQAGQIGQPRQAVGGEERKNSKVGNKRKRNERGRAVIEESQILGGDRNSHKYTPSSDEEEYDKAAHQHDLIIQSQLGDNAAGGSSSINSSSSSMLNANLRNRYKDVQRERDIIARKNNKSDAASSSPSSPSAAFEDGATDNGNSNSSSNNRGRPLSPVSETSMAYVHNDDDDDYNDAIVTPTSRPSTPSVPLPTTNSATTVAAKSAADTIPTPSKKKKKKLSKSSSSNSLSKSSSKRERSIQDPTLPSSSSFMATPTPRPKERYTDLGGLHSTIVEIRQLIEYPLSHPELFSHLGIHPPRGVLLRGPPGCGKTHIANAIAGQLNVTFYKLSAPEIVSSMSGESESRLRDLFQVASSSAPSIIFIDEIDAIAPKRGGDSGGSGGGKGMEKRIVAQLLTCMDSLTPENNRNGSPVMVLAATNRPDSLDSALRRAGRFDREIILGVPDEEGRESILRVMTDGMRLDGCIDFKLLAKKTPGYVGADIRSLTKEAGVVAINRIFKKVLIQDDAENTAARISASSTGTCNSVEQSIQVGDGNEKQTSDVFDIHSVVPFTPEQLEPLSITMDDFLLAVPHVQPSSKREGFATVPDVSWDDIGALSCIREELTLSVLEPITHPEKFKALGLPLPAGVLLYGPPGCGKTLLAKAIANESGANFISVKGPELLDKYVGESERAVRTVFERARSSSPCIVFFDELDSLCPKRGSDSSGGGVSERVVNQLLTEMDGLDSRRSIFVIAATNRPELIDPAMLRPGRLDKLLYVPLPSPADRVSILKANAKNIKLGPDVNLETIAMSPRAEGYSGADCAALLREAGLAVLRDGVVHEREKSVVDDNCSIPPLQITATHFDYAFNHVMPSVSKRDQSRYDKMRDRMARARTRGTLTDEKTQSAKDEEDHLASNLKK